MLSLLLVMAFEASDISGLRWFVHDQKKFFLTRFRMFLRNFGTPLFLNPELHFFGSMLGNSCTDELVLFGQRILESHVQTDRQAVTWRRPACLFR